jgi:peptide/nickel transport system substrate-binding protein
MTSTGWGGAWPAVTMAHVKKRSLTLITSAALLALGAPLALAGCSSDSSGDGSENTRTTLTYATGDAEPECLDPHVGGNYPQALAATQYAENLVSRDEDGKIIPWLAESWKVSDDGLTWEFRLKKDVEFTDGTPLTWEAVKANVEHVMDPDTASSTGYLAFQRIESVSKGDTDLDAVVKMKTPDSALLESFAQVWNAIESPKALERTQEENCKAPVGTGPFKVTSWTKQDRVVFERNEDYSTPPQDAKNQDGPAALKKIEWRFIPDSATRYAALQSGDVDVIDNAQPDTIKAASKESGIEHLDAPRPGASNRIELNSGQAPFDDQRVREAFIRSVDVDAAVDSLFLGTAKRSHSAMSSVEPFSYDAKDAYPYDLDAAKKLLDEAGWKEGKDGIRVKDGKKLTLRFPVSTNQSIPAEQSLFEQIQAGAREAGFDVKISLLDLAGWYDALGSNKYELVSAPYTKVGSDVLRILFHSSGITPAPSGYFANHAQIDDPKLDKALDQAQSTVDDEATRKQLYTDAQKEIAEKQVILPLYDQQNHYLFRAGVKGLRSLPTVATPTFLDVDPLPAK